MDALSRVTSAQEAMAQAPTVVVKVGSALLVDDFRPSAHQHHGAEVKHERERHQQQWRQRQSVSAKR